MEQDVIDLSHQVPCGRVVPDRPEHLREVQSHTDRKCGQYERQRRAGPHRLREMPVDGIEVASMERETCGAGEREHAHRVVVHPALVDGSEGSAEPVGCVVPPPSIHREECALGLTDDERIGVARSRRHGGRLLEGRLGSLGLAHEQVRLSGAGRAPGRATGSTAVPGRPRTSRRSSPAPGPRGTSLCAASPSRRRRMRCRPPGPGRRLRHRRSPPIAGRLPSAPSSPSPTRPRRRVGDTPRSRRCRAPTATAGPSTSVRPRTFPASRPSRGARSALVRPYSAGGEGRSPRNHSLRTSRRHAGGAFMTMSGSTRPSSPSRNSRKSAW